MTLNQLKYAIEIQKMGSVNEAAKSLFVSQPSLTAALKALEKEVGFDIFTIYVKEESACKENFLFCRIFVFP